MVYNLVQKLILFPFIVNLQTHILSDSIGKVTHSRTECKLDNMLPCIEKGIDRLSCCSCRAINHPTPSIGTGPHIENELRIQILIQYIIIYVVSLQRVRHQQVPVLVVGRGSMSLRQYHRRHGCLGAGKYITSGSRAINLRSLRCSSTSRSNSSIHAIEFDAGSPKNSENRHRTK
jgi:hypothetical protein